LTYFCKRGTFSQQLSRAVSKKNPTHWRSVQMKKQQQKQETQEDVEEAHKANFINVCRDVTGEVFRTI